MSMELIAIISASIALAGLIITGQNGLRREMRGQREELQAHRKETQAEFKAVREEMQAHREENQAEFKTVREEIGGLRERMAHVEGLLEGLLREAFIGRRAAPAEAVAEVPGPYDKT